MWERLWTLPQAVAWEEIRCDDIVALYVRTFVAASGPSVSDSLYVRLSSEARQLEAKIGLTPKSMIDLRWEIAAPESKPKPKKQPQGEQPLRAYVPRAR